MVTVFSCTLSNTQSGLLPKDFERVGNLAFTQLAKLRHQGAFSTVSQTFDICCNIAAETTFTMADELRGLDPRNENLLTKWYKVSLEHGFFSLPLISYRMLYRSLRKMLRRLQGDRQDCQPLLLVY